MKNIASYVIIILIIFSSCSDKLSESKAKKQILNSLNLPIKETKEIEYKDYWVGWRLTYKNLSPFIENGLLNSEHYGRGLNGHLYTEPTKKGEKYVVSDDGKKFKVELCSLEFGEINSILEYPELNMAEVKYTIKRTKLTPFGELTNPPLDLTINKIATFSKYNDGWAISK